MASTTEHFGLTLPEENDMFDVADLNTNFTAIDTALADMEAQIAAAAATAPSAVKSIQTVQASHSTGKAGSTTLDISAVDPSRCMVLVNRLYDSTGFAVSMSYSLTETSVTINTGSSVNGTVTIQLQIVEFY